MGLDMTLYYCIPKSMEVAGSRLRSFRSTYQHWDEIT